MENFKAWGELRLSEDFYSKHKDLFAKLEPKLWYITKDIQTNVRTKNKIVVNFNSGIRKNGDFYHCNKSVLEFDWRIVTANVHAISMLERCLVANEVGQQLAELMAQEKERIEVEFTIHQTSFQSFQSFIGYLKPHKFSNGKYILSYYSYAEPKVVYA